jgi:hypothetical protein
VQTRYVRASIISVLVAVVAICIAISISSSDTTPTKSVASNVESVTPPPDGLQRPQADIVVDLQDGYTGRLAIDGKTIPDDELERVKSLGQFTFHPEKGNTIDIFEAGTHKATVFYWPSDQPEPTVPQSYTWSFRVTS